MSPEQAEGLPVGPSSDMFSLAGVLIFAARGQGPFGTGDMAALLYRVVHGTPSLDQIPDGIRPLVSRCLSRDASLRPTASEFLAELSAAYPSAADLTDWLPSRLLERSAQRATVGRHAAPRATTGLPVAAAGPGPGLALATETASSAGPADDGPATPPLPGGGQGYRRRAVEVGGGRRGGGVRGGRRGRGGVAGLGPFPGVGRRRRPNPAAPSTTPTVGNLKLDQLRVGDCLTGSEMELNTSDPWPKLTQAVPCSRPHTAEVFLADNNFWPERSAFPGNDRDQQGRQRGVQYRVPCLRRDRVRQVDLHLDQYHPGRHDLADGRPGPALHRVLRHGQAAGRRDPDPLDQGLP